MQEREGFDVGLRRQTMVIITVLGDKTAADPGLRGPCSPTGNCTRFD